MDGNLIEIKHRISSIDSTLKITKAMKLVASVKLKRMKDIFDANLNYTNELKDVLYKTLSYYDFNSKKLPDCLKKYNSSNKLYIVVTSTLGLCGSYNYSIFKYLKDILKEGDEILIIGEKGYIHYKNFKNKVYDDYKNLFLNLTYNNVKSLRHFIFKIYKQNKYKSVELIYTKYVNSLNFKVKNIQVLPLNFELDNYKEKFVFKPIIEPNVNEVLNKMLPHYIDALLFNKLLESNVCEYASRRNAMENATNNAHELIDDLNIKFNKARQSHITNEIIEVVSGAKSSKGE